MAQDAAGSEPRSRCEITVVMPSPRIETPYSTSATSIVGFWWVMTISYDVVRSSSNNEISRRRLTSSSAASISSST